jgi:hypothetical protein
MTMTPFTKSFRQLFVISFLIITFTTTAMHDLQLQLQGSTPQDELTVFDCPFTISSMVRPPVRYVGKQMHNEIFQRHNLPSKITDPVIWFSMSNAPKGYPPFILLPLKNCINFYDGDLLHIYDSGKSGIYEGKPLLINGTCKKNPSLLGNNFCEQINNAENRFYDNPMLRYIDAQDSLKEFESAGIIADTITRPVTSLLNTNTGQLSIVREKKCSPGPNYMKNKKDLMQSIIYEEIPHNQNWVTYVKNREYGNKLGKRQ